MRWLRRTSSPRPFAFRPGQSVGAPAQFKRGSPAGKALDVSHDLDAGPPPDLEIITGALADAMQGIPAPLSGTPEYAALSAAVSRAAAGTDFHQIGIQALRLVMLHVLAGLTLQRMQILAQIEQGGPQ